MAAENHDFPWIMVRKNAGEVIKIFLRKDQDGPYLDFRIENGPERKTDKGMILDLSLLPDLIQALEWMMGTAMELGEGKKARPEST